MKVKLWSVIFCSCLFVCGSIASAQTAPPKDDVQSVNQGADNASTNDDTPDQQTPPAQTPPGQAAPQPQTVPGTPSIPKPTIQLPPAPAPQTTTSTIPPQHDTEGDYISVEPFYWLTKDSPVIAAGNGNFVSALTAPYTPPGSLHFPAHSKYGEGIVVTAPTSHENSLQFTWTHVRGANAAYIPVPLNFFGNSFAAGDLLYTNFRVTTLKLSWNYLTWPYPSKGAKLRIKTLYEIQYAMISGAFNAPADVNAVQTGGSKDIIFPTFGVGVEYHLAKRFYLNVKASAFGFPHRADIVDGEGEMVLRMGHVDAFIGDKYYHFKTSPQANDQYFFYTMTGPFLGLRFIWH